MMWLIERCRLLEEERNLESSRNEELLESKKKLEGDVKELRYLTAELCKKIKIDEKAVRVAEEESQSLREKIVELTDRCNAAESTALKQRRTDKRLNGLIVKKAKEAEYARAQQAKVEQGAEQMVGVQSSALGVGEEGVKRRVHLHRVLVL